MSISLNNSNYSSLNTSPATRNQEAAPNAQATNQTANAIAEPQIIHYNKGQKKTSSLIPTENYPIGKGGYGTVYEHKYNENLVVKKSEQDLTNEFFMGFRLNHPTLVKSNELYVKHYKNGSSKYKMVMNKIDGKELTQYFRGYYQLSMEETKQAFEQAKNCCLYLYDKKIAWGDVNNGNIFFTNTNRNLQICDFGAWSKIEDSDERVMQLFLGAAEIAGWLIKSSFIREDGIDSEKEAKVQFPVKYFNTQPIKQILSIIDYTKKEWFVNNSKNVKLMSDDQKKEWLADYFDVVLAQLISD